MSVSTQVIILGASGDLTARKLVPAFFHAKQQGFFPDDVQLVGVARRPWDDAGFQEHLTGGVAESVGPKMVGRIFLGEVRYVQTHLDTEDDYRTLAERLDGLSDGPCDRVFYLAIKPDLFLPAVKGMRSVGLLEEADDRYARVVVEKPFGHDLPSARELNTELLKQIKETQLYRIDHYLGKETVQNILAFRFRNAMIEPMWNQKYVELVQITVAEEVGMEGGRGGFYDTAGAVRDILQNHALQLLALVAMEPPSRLDAESIRNEKVKVLQALRPPEQTKEYQRHVVRGQFDDYKEARGVAPDSQTETYVAARTYIDNWRWAGVPFLLRTGKKLPKRFTSITVQYRMPPFELFGDNTEDVCHMRPNHLRLRIQPEEGIDLDFEVKKPGGGMEMANTKMSFDYADMFGDAGPEAYQRLLQDVVQGDQSLFIRSDELEASWEWADSLRTAMTQTPLHTYDSGTWGPDAAFGLFGECEGRWARG